MSERWSAIGSEEPAESVATGSSSANGAKPDDIVGLRDGPEAADEGSVFLAELVRAMQTTAGLERVKIGEDTERRRQAHIDRVRTRQASEAERIRELAAEDMKAIDAWSDGEKQRIKLERERRTTDLRDDLDLSLSEHSSKIDLEIAAVETVIATYRADVDAFFDGLDRETDLVLIAQQAASRPIFPTLDAVATMVATDVTDVAEIEPVTAEAVPAGADDGASGAEPAGVTEPTMVGVMDPQAAAEPVESWLTPPETSPQPVRAGPFDDVDQGDAAREGAEPVTAAIGQGDSKSGAMLQSMPIKPMGWLRRHVTSGDHTNGES